jgi:putative restriction endonuclease
MKKLEEILNKMGKLRVDNNKNRYSAGKAPHKPVLLLSLIILNENNRMDLKDIKADLVLRETWYELWKCLEYSRPGPIHLPLYHLRSDGFWNIEMKEGVLPHQPKSIDGLYSMVGRISMKEDLIEFIEDEATRDKLISSILNGGYFSEYEVNNLRDKIEELNGSFLYENELVQKVKEEFSIEKRTYEEDLKPRRDPAFRRLVLFAYDETCAVCGMKLQTTSGISVIDASHILPFSGCSLSTDLDTRIL